MAGFGLKATGDQIGGGAGIEVTRTVVGGRGVVGGACDAVELTIVEVGAGAGTLEPRHVVVPLREHMKRTDLLLGRVTGADPDSKKVFVTTAEGDERQLEYDQLIVALGSVSRPTAARARMRRRSCMRCSVPSSRQRRNCKNTVAQGGDSWGSLRQAQPERTR